MLAVRAAWGNADVRPRRAAVLPHGSGALALGWRRAQGIRVSAAIACRTGVTTPKPPQPQPEPPLRPTDRNKENVLQQEQSKGEVRPDGPGDDTAPVKPESDKH